VLANNHDTARFLSLEGADLNGAMLHTAFILSVRGIPQLYYGEEIAMEGKDDPDNRRDFPVSAFQASGREGRAEQMFEWTKQWIRLRREHSAVRRGRLIDLHYDDNVYVFARQDSTETVIIAINRQDKEQDVTVPFKSVLPLIGKIRASIRKIPVPSGETTLTLPANSAVALKAS
jgi:glycosidase